MLYFRVEVDPGSLPEGSVVTDDATITGGGAPEVQASTEATISEQEAPFDLIPGPGGLGASLTSEDGEPATQAGSHPGELAVQLGFPVKTANLEAGAGTITAADGGVRDVQAALPKGVVLNPNAVAVRCSETDLELEECPNASAVGVADLHTGLEGVLTYQSPLFDLFPSPGTAAVFSFNAAGLNIYPHILGGVHAGDYALQAVSHDVIQLGAHPLYGIRTQFWGDSSSPIYDYTRGRCDFEGVLQHGPCSVTPQKTPLLTMPTSCSSSLELSATVDSWNHQSVARERQVHVTDGVGNPTPVTGCNALDFSGIHAPTLKARPTTNLADSPSGLEVDLHIPQKQEEVGTLAEPHLKEAVVTLPEGIALNPASANGLEGCSSAQVGIDPQTGVPDDRPATCPDASKVGLVEVDTPLLDHPLPGAVYVATPHDNPFDSLLAIYIVVEDEASGVIIKLAGHVVPNPQTGQLVTTFSNNPQLPFEDFKLEFFGGAGGVLRTPATCGSYSTTSQLFPWSGTAPATPKDSYAIAKDPNGGACATSPSQERNAPSFDGGTLSPLAGNYSPFVVTLRREDGTQQFSALNLTPPSGLVGKLAGTPYCPESALKEAEGKTGAQEKASPSCPAASRVGTVTVGAGSGPAPYYATGTAYLTGPYKGAPISLAIVTPAAAGPYDLGTVVVRSALYVNSETAQINAVSDPLPTILQGIPLDVRSVQVKLDKPEFILNPTNCDPMSFQGQLISVLGQSASLLNRFQVAECTNLGFKPTLKLRLKGGTKRTSSPAVIADLTTRPGDANIKRVQVKLPRAAFLDNAHIGTVCTRVQFREGGGNGEKCPADSVYGQASAVSPLLDGPLTGTVFLRSNPEHELPDLVVALNGPASQPIDIAVAGLTDSVKGALRNTFEAVPDAPVSSFHLELFGGNRGLIELSENICLNKQRAAVQLDGQNGLTSDSNPVVGTSCRHKHRRRHRHHHRHHRRRG